MGCFSGQVFPAVNSDPPRRDNPRVKGRPEAGKLLQDNLSTVQRPCGDPDKQGDQEKQNGCKANKCEPSGGNKALFHFSSPSFF